MDRRSPANVTKMIEEELEEQKRAAHEAPTKPPVESLNIEIDSFSLELIEAAPSTRPTPLQVKEELIAKSDPRQEGADGVAERTTGPPPPDYSPAELGPTTKR